MTTTTHPRMHTQSVDPVFEHQRVVRRRYPRAKLSAVYAIDGVTWIAWRIVSGDGGVRLSRDWADDADAWGEAAGRIMP